MSSKSYPKSSEGYPNDEPTVIRERLRELREEFDALVRQTGDRASARDDDDGGYADLRRDLERLRCALDARSAGSGMAMPTPSSTAASAHPPSPPFPPFPPYPPYPPVAPFPPYPPYPPNCGCCAPKPCGCVKCSGHAAPPAQPVPGPAPAPPAVLASSSSSRGSSSSQSSRRPIVIRLPSSSSSSHYREVIR